MQKAILSLLFVVALAYAQSPQNGPLSVTTLTSGVMQSGVLPPTTLANNYHVDLYAIWIPENTTAVNFTYANTDSSSCSYIHFFFRDEALPCSYHDYSSTNYACANAYDPGNGISGSNNYIAYPGYSNDLFEFGVNKYYYIGIGRYSTYNTDTCTYNFMATLNGSCPTGSISQALSSYQTVCGPMYTTATSGVVYNLNNTVGSGFQAVYKIVTPLDVGHIYVQINSTSSGAYIYGKNYADGSYTGYNCYTGSYTLIGTIYSYDLFCWTPRAGDFYITVQDDSTFTGVAQFTVAQCPAGMGGFNCSFPSVPLNMTNLPLTINIPYNSADSVNYLDYGMAYFYVDIPANITNQGELSILTAAVSGSGYTYYRRNGYPEDSSTYGYEDSFEYDSYPSAYTINQFEWQVAGRIYFGLECTTNGGCNITIGANSSMTSSSGVVTTGASGVVTTGASGVVTTGASGVVTTGAMVTTGATGAVTTGAITTRSVTTSRGLTTSAEEQSSISSTLIPSVILGLVAYFLF